MRKLIKYVYFKVVYSLVSLMVMITSGRKSLIIKKVILGTMLLGLANSENALAQQNKPKKNKKDIPDNVNKENLIIKDTVNYDVTFLEKECEVKPEFPGGDKDLEKYFEDNIKYPRIANKAGVEGKVWVGFDIQKSGSIGMIQVLKGIGAGLDDETIRVIKMMPKWNSAIKNNKNVSVYVNIQFQYQLCDTTKTEYYFDSVSKQRIVVRKEKVIPVYKDVSCYSISSTENEIEPSFTEKIMSGFKNIWNWIFGE